MSTEPGQATDVEDATDYSNMAPDEEMAARLEQLLHEDHVMRRLQIESGAERLRDEPNVVAVNDRNGESLFIKVEC